MGLVALGAGVCGSGDELGRDQHGRSGADALSDRRPVCPAAVVAPRRRS
jgi:hypothetical protein